MANFSDSIQSLLQNFDGFISNKTVMGTPVEINGATIIPLMEMSFGVGAGAYEKNSQGAGGGMGGKISTSAVLIIQKDGGVRLVNIKNQDPLTKVMDSIPELADTIKNLVSKKEKDQEVEEKAEEILHQSDSEKEA